MLTALQKFPAPYFGGKRDAAPLIWQMLGDCAHYVEAFGGTCAVLLERPHPCNRPYSSETVNDADGLLINALRAMAFHPQATAEAASWYVSEADVMARHLAILRFVADQPLERLMADPYWCDPVMGGWWLYGLCAWIGGGWCSGAGPWVVDPVAGRLVKRATRTMAGATRQRPHLSDDGMGVHRPGTREPGVTRQLPHLSNNGMGVNHADTRELGVTRKLPHLSDDGRGVHRPGTREPGVTREAGQAPPQPDDWPAQVEADYAATGGFHPMTMPELRRWFAFLSARLRHVRIVHGAWERVVTTGALKTLVVRQGQGVVGVFMDPPYSSQERDAGLYRKDNAVGANVAADVRAWCLAQGGDPDLRIILAGYAGEGHEVLEAHGWTVRSWFKDGHLKGGMGQQRDGGAGAHQQHRERLWCSPHCAGLEKNDAQMSLW
jgi:D12 class N6 adenine-specific DNA methyltransferase